MTATTAKRHTLVAKAIRLPAEPLLDAARFNDRTCADVAADLGASRRTVHRLRKEGVSLDQADKYATALGYHPINIWGLEAWEQALDAEDDFCFTPTGELHDGQQRLAL